MGWRDTSLRIFGLGDIITNVSLNISGVISYFLSMQYFLEKLKEFLVLILEVNLLMSVM